jgi:cysteine-rich repeat protein
MKNHRNSTSWRFGAVALAAAVLGVAPLAGADPAPDANSVLILDTTVTGGATSVEATQAALLGLTPVVVDAATWGAMSTADFATYRALILGDPNCVTGTGPLAPAEANRPVWSPAVTGNIITIGTDPVLHQAIPGAVNLINKSIAYAADAATTGAVIGLSCYYFDAVAGTPVPVLDQFGSFSVVGQGGCPAASHIIAVHPALAGLTDADLSNWGCSTHEGFDSWPVDFLPLVISTDVPSPFVAPDGTSGAPYIMARGEDLAPILCGNGVLDGAEQCDDGNVISGDGCSAQCLIEEPVNDPPVCDGASADPMQLWPPNHKLGNVGIAGVTDPDGDDVSLTITTVTQDEPVKVNKGDKSPDAVINPDSTVGVRVERSAKGDGRVYRIGFMADDGNGGTCEGVVRTCVPHDQGQGNDCVDGGDSDSYDSLLP